MSNKQRRGGNEYEDDAEYEDEDSDVEVEEIKDRLHRELSLAFASGQVCVWINSDEHEEAHEIIKRFCLDQDDPYERYTWDMITGLVVFGQDGEVDKSRSTNEVGTPTAAMQRLLPKPEEKKSMFRVLVIEDYQMMKRPDSVAFIRKVASIGKSADVGLIILSIPGEKAPAEVAPLFWIIDHKLPNKEELEVVVERLAKAAAAQGRDDVVKSKTHRGEVADSLLGLTLQQAETALTRSEVEHGHYDALKIWDYKAQAINHSEALAIRQPTVTREDAKGIDGVIDVGLDLLKGMRKAKGKLRPRGMLLSGVAGSGKSLAADVLGAEAGLPVLRLDIGSLMGGLVGSTEENTRRAFAMAEALAPVILQLDEFEKAMPSGKASHSGSDVGTRLHGKMLTWLEEMQAPVFVIATANEVDQFDGPMLRRFDFLFFFDVIDAESRAAVWELYFEKYGVEGQKPKDDDYSGADVEKCVRLAHITGRPLKSAGELIIPTAKVAIAEIEAMRKWAEGKCINAATGKPYRRPRESSALDGHEPGARTVRPRR